MGAPEIDSDRPPGSNDFEEFIGNEKPTPAAPGGMEDLREIATGKPAQDGDRVPTKFQSGNEELASVTQL